MTTALLDRRAPVLGQPRASALDSAWWARVWGAPLAVKLHWMLRIGVAAEFLGHGLAGLYRSPAWIPYFTLFGFSRQFAHDHLFYVTGTVDILMAALVLWRPMRAAMLYMAVWGMFTAWLRPLTGESFFEVVERGANYGMPAAFLLLSGWGGATLRPWFERVRPTAELSRDVARRLGWVMQGSIALLLIGHGGLGLVADKKEWFDFFGWFRISSASVSAGHLMQWVGLFEVALGVAVLVKPLRGLLLFILVWKVGTELLRPLVGQPNFQFIERAGDYVLPVALLWVLVWLRSVAASSQPIAVRPPVATPAPATRPRPLPAPVPAPAWSSRSPLAPGGPDPQVLAAAAALNARLAARRADPASRTTRLLVSSGDAPTSGA